MMNKSIETQFLFQSQYVSISGVKLHYIEEGRGDPILFLHGVPTSSYIWRNIIPHLNSLGRCIALDLVGFGKSDKPNIEYTLQEHCEYFSHFIEKLDLNNITLVLHNWGSIIGFNYAMQHPKRIKGLVFYESYIQPYEGQNLALPYEEQSYDLLNNLEKDSEVSFSLVDKLLTQGMVRPFNEKELAYYREPFQKKEMQKPLLQYLKELPHHNPTINQLIKDYSEKLQKSSIPKLMLYSIPGFITTIADVLWAKDHLPNLQVAEVGEALHYAQESNPILMGENISIWLQGIEQKEK